MRGPVLERFELKRSNLFLYGRAAEVSFRIAARGAVRVRLSVLRAADRKPVVSLDLGELAPRTEHSAQLTATELGALPEARYLVRLSARDARGRRLRDAPSAELDFSHYQFPIAGLYGWGGKDARFGAKRSGRRHQGQDLTAAEGTPVVSPRGGEVEKVAYQRSGAGHYVVVDGRGEDRDYVFMHLRSGSIPVVQGDSVRTGEKIGEVGNTGASSGAHLHFEIWTGGWGSRGGEPIDPLPLLRAWAG